MYKTEQTFNIVEKINLPPPLQQLYILQINPISNHLYTFPYNLNKLILVTWYKWSIIFQGGVQDLYPSHVCMCVCLCVVSGGTLSIPKGLHVSIIPTTCQWSIHTAYYIQYSSYGIVVSFLTSKSYSKSISCSNLGLKYFTYTPVGVHMSISMDVPRCECKVLGSILRRQS